MASLPRLHTLTLIDGSSLDDIPSNQGASIHFLHSFSSPTLVHLRIEPPRPTYLLTRVRLQEAYEANHRLLALMLKRLLLVEGGQESVRLPRLEKVEIAEEVFEGVVRDLYGFSDEIAEVQIGGVSVCWDRSGETAWPEDRWDKVKRRKDQEKLRTLRAGGV